MTEMQIDSAGTTITVPGLNTYEAARNLTAQTFGYLGSGQEIFLFMLDRLEQLEKRFDEETPSESGGNGNAMTKRGPGRPRKS